MWPSKKQEDSWLQYIIEGTQTLSHHMKFFNLINYKINTSTDIRALLHILQLQSTDGRAIFVTVTDHYDHFRKLLTWSY